MTPNLDGMTALPPLARRPSRTRCLLGTRNQQDGPDEILTSSHGRIGWLSRQA
jgi:hypothetical protein